MSTASNRVPPRLHLAVLCSYVTFDADDQPFSVVEPMYGIGIAPDPDGRLRAPDLAVYLQLNDEEAAGVYWLSVEVRKPGDAHVPTGRVIPNGRTPPQELFFPGDHDPLKAFEYVVHLRGLVFPEPGWYDFHVMCNHLSLHTVESTQPPLRLRVVPAERSAEG